MAAAAAVDRFWLLYNASAVRIEQVVEFMHNDVPRRTLDGSVGSNEFTTQDLFSNGKPSVYGKCCMASFVVWKRCPSLHYRMF